MRLLKTVFKIHTYTSTCFCINHAGHIINCFEKMKLTRFFESLSFESFTHIIYFTHLFVDHQEIFHPLFLLFRLKGYAVRF